MLRIIDHFKPFWLKVLANYKFVGLSQEIFLRLAFEELIYLKNYMHILFIKMLGVIVHFELFWLKLLQICGINYNFH